MTAFALIHGAWGRGWHAHPLVDELTRRGHDVVSPDLPCDDTQATFSDYARVVEEAIGDREDVVLVAKSLGGLTAPLVRAPVREIVLIAALLAQPGRSLNDQFASEAMLVPGAMRGVSPDGQGRTVWDEPTAIEVLFHDCEPGLAAEAAARLRPQAGALYEEPCPLEAWPDVPVRYVLCRDDRIVSNDWARRAVPERLGVEPVELPGGHTPGLARPAERADLLLG